MMERFFAGHFHSSVCLILATLVLISAFGEVASQLTWTVPGAEGVEWAASHYCSGHGFIFTDTMGGPNQTFPVCECNGCYESDTCAVKSANCSIDVQSGDPGFLEPFWIKNAQVSAVVPSWYRMSYLITDHVEDLMTPELDSLIRRLHELVGNAVAKDKFIVPGAGSIQLINAAIHSLSYSSSREYLKNQTLVVASAPYYSDYRSQTQMFDSVRYKWDGDSKKWVNSTEGKKFIEIITNPNNPDGYHQKSILKGDVKVLSDRVCWWPHYTSITEAADDDVMLFSLSKLSGHAGTRFGWALVKDEALYERIRDYVEGNINKVSHDSELRATQVLRTIIEGYDKNISQQKMFDIGYAELRQRWLKIEYLFNKTDRFTLQNTTSGYCNFFKQVRQPAEAYAWVTCNRDMGIDCTSVFNNAGIQGFYGTSFGGNLNQVRLSLVKRRDNFDILIEKLTRLIDSPVNEGIISTSLSSKTQMLDG